MSETNSNLERFIIIQKDLVQHLIKKKILNSLQNNKVYDKLKKYIN